MIVLAIDPGPKESAYVLYDGKGIIASDYLLNEDMLSMFCLTPPEHTDLVVEWIEGYGLAVGKETFETCYWVGRFIQANGNGHRIGRKAIKSHLCNTTQAKDRDIRAALIDRFGEPGTKKKPGPTYGITGDEWSALACAVTFADTMVKNE